MRSIQVAFCILGLLVLAQGFSCPKNFCDNIDCSKGLTAEQCPGSMIPKTSMCGCCPTCFQFLPFGSKCETPFLHIPNTLTGIRKVCTGMCFNHKCIPL